MVLIGVLGKNMGEFILPDSPSVLGGSMPKNCVSLISMLIPMFRVKSLVIAHSDSKKEHKISISHRFVWSSYWVLAMGISWLIFFNYTGSHSFLKDQS